MSTHVSPTVSGFSTTNLRTCCTSVTTPTPSTCGRCTGWYTRRREENGFRHQQAQPYGQTAVQWQALESVRTELSIRHQVNGREKRIGKLPVDGWCAKTRPACRFHGCFFHGCATIKMKQIRRMARLWLRRWKRHAATRIPPASS